MPCQAPCEPGRLGCFVRGPWEVGGGGSSQPEVPRRARAAFKLGGGLATPSTPAGRGTRRRLGLLIVVLSPQTLTEWTAPHCWVRQIPDVIGLVVAYTLCCLPAAICKIIKMSAS